MIRALSSFDTTLETESGTHRASWIGGIDGARCRTGSPVSAWSESGVVCGSFSFAEATTTLIANVSVHGGALRCSVDIRSAPDADFRASSVRFASLYRWLNFDDRRLRALLLD